MCAFSYIHQHTYATSLYVFIISFARILYFHCRAIAKRMNISIATFTENTEFWKNGNSAHIKRGIIIIIYIYIYVMKHCCKHIKPQHVHGTIHGHASDKRLLAAHIKGRQDCWQLYKLYLYNVTIKKDAKSLVNLQWSLVTCTKKYNQYVLLLLLQLSSFYMYWAPDVNQMFWYKLWLIKQVSKQRSDQI